MYFCIYCNYNTNCSGNFCNHKKTQKHISNKEEYELKNIIQNQKEQEFEKLKKKYYKIKKQKKAIELEKEQLLTKHRFRKKRTNRHCRNC
jgi:hypothetical protein